MIFQVFGQALNPGDKLRNREQEIRAAAEAMERGGVIGLVTDTVWGLAARIDRPGAVDRIYELKGRDFNQPMAVLVADLESARKIGGNWPQEADEMAGAFWPGGLTIIVNASESLAAVAHSQTLTVGLRMPDHKIPLGLMRLTGPLAATSANLSGERELMDAGEIREKFGDKLAVILDGPPKPLGAASTVIDVSRKPFRLLRQGTLEAEIRRRFGPWFET